MTALGIRAVGVAAPGLPGWPATADVLAGRTPFVVQPVASLDSNLPGTERRRANEVSRWSIAAALEATGDARVEDVAALATVFGSADGDGHVLDAMLAALAQDKVAVSPTIFHNSVFNAPAGYWGIGAKASGSSTTLCAGEGTFAAALLESHGLVAATQESVLLVVCDLPFPARVPFTCGGRAPFAGALLLEPLGVDASRWGCIDGLRVTRRAARRPDHDALVDGEFAGNASAAALLLLGAIARGHAASIALPYIDDAVVELTWQP